MIFFLAFLGFLRPPGHLGPAFGFISIHTKLFWDGGHASFFMAPRLFASIFWRHGFTSFGGFQYSVCHLYTLCHHFLNIHVWYIYGLLTCIHHNNQSHVGKYTGMVWVLSF